ncbi:MAG: hypothetical protein AB1793_01965 [Candidatus Thermoplasmatota archaeon]
MAEVELIAAVCPKCGSSLRFPADLDKAHCMYCGTQVIIGRGRTECKVCDGFGRIDVCKACGGSGKCTWSVSSNAHGHNDFTSILAYGSVSYCVNGYCYACKGKGKGGSLSACPFCGGTGKCPRCLGTEKCPACRGLGVLPGPSGSMVCPGCGGRGYVEGDPQPRAPAAEKCPNCGRTMARGTCFCEGCGFGVACPRCGMIWPRGSLMCPRCGYHRGERV